MDQNSKNITLLEFSRYFKTLYESRNINKAELSRLSKVSEATLSRLESGTQQPSPGTLKKLAPHLMVSDEELMIKAGYLPNNIIDNKHNKMLEQMKPIVIQLCNNDNFLDKLAISMGKKISFKGFSALVSKQSFADIIDLIASVGFNFNAEEDDNGNVNFWLESVSELSDDDKKTLEEMPKLVLLNETNLYHKLPSVNNDSPALSPKEERDIAKDVEKMLSDLANDKEISFQGEPMDEDEREALRLFIENSLRLFKQTTKKKFNRNEK